LPNLFPSLRVLATCGALAAAATPAHAIGDGARAYMLVPKGSHVLSAYGIFLDGNSSLDPSTAASNANIAIDVAALQYTHSITTGKTQSGLFVIMPIGRVNGSVDIERPLRPPSPSPAAARASATSSSAPSSASSAPPRLPRATISR
jgi:hypothetical protein